MSTDEILAEHPDLTTKDIRRLVACRRMRKTGLFGRQLVGDLT